VICEVAFYPAFVLIGPYLSLSREARWPVTRFSVEISTRYYLLQSK
jgi:hypothetical protein